MLEKIKLTPSVKDILIQNISKNPNTTLYWEVFLSEEEVTHALWIEDIDELINTGTQSDFILCKTPKGSLKFSKKIEEFAQYLLEDYSIPLALINQNLSEILFVKEKEKKDYQPIDTQILREIFSEKKIKDFMSDFEMRRPQMLMIKAVIDSFNQSTASIIEAPTGTGKSLAYLLPAALFAFTNNSKVIISTFTKNLQHQLIEKDIPLVVKLLNLPIQYSLIKGKGNYLCLKRFHEFLNWEKQALELYDVKENEEDSSDHLNTVSQWLSETKTGDLEELPYESIKNIWGEVNTSSDLCANKRCPYYGDCFYYKMKNNCHKNHLLVVNHSLLISQLELDFHDIPYELIPEFHHLIIDEAHNFSKSALIEETASYLGMISRLNRLYSSGKTKKGIFNFLLSLLNQKTVDPRQTQIIEIVNNSIPFQTENLKQKLNSFFLRLYDILEINISPYENSFRITTEKHFHFKELDFDYEILKESMNNYCELLKSISSKFSALPQEFVIENQTQLKVIDQTKKYLETSFELLDLIFRVQPSFIALWFEIQKKSQNVSIHYVNLNNDEFLNKTLYEKKNSIIFTSATLAVNKNFHDFKESIHFKQEAQSVVLQSPFNYQENALFIIPKEITAPAGSDIKDSQYIKDILVFIKDAITASKGGVLVLCTSLKQVELIKDYLSEEIEYPLFIQNSVHYSKLISDFKASKNGVLIGVDSFWEGLDVKGDALRMVIITKLPFRPPSNPISQTQQELIESQGENSFIKLSVPEAVIKFKQGFGRLIRSQTDRGVVICLDSRILHKSYGKIFTQSLPIPPQILSNKESIKEIQSFFKKSH